MTEQTDAAEVEGSNAAFYAKHYSDWTVHALPLMVYVPTGNDGPKVDAMELVQEILTEAAFDIRIEPLDDYIAAREAAAEARGAERALREAAEDYERMYNQPGSATGADWLRARAAQVAPSRVPGEGS